MSTRQMITRDAIGVARKVVENGFWRAHHDLSEIAANEIARSGTLWYADLDALEACVGRKLTKREHWLWETTLREELTRLAPVERTPTLTAPS